ncbi:MAG: methyltransferase domain-containing protein [Chloroflexi bacterium]|nr:methyltransferase domain-containing protein [Chloroflexota bacterium]
MTNPTDMSEPGPGYIVDAENAAEMARLTRQARVLSEHLGLFPAQLNVAQCQHILDIGCGPGEWALEVIQRFPGSQITGIDISELMVRYARYVVESQRISNVQFQVMDARQPLAFPDASFDLVNARFIIGFMPTSAWPQLLRECFRVLRPGGILCSCEPESFGTTTSPSFTRYNLLMTQAMRLAGQCFTPEGELYGISAVQPRLLREAGFQDIQQEALVINYSTGMPAHRATYDNLKTFMKLLQPLLVRSGLTTQENIDLLYTRTLEEMEADDFCAAGFFYRVWGEKPE